jgi:nuclear pore complex protein Nup107
VTELSVEHLSHIKTEAICGYAFDFTLPGSEIQDEMELMAARHARPDTQRRSLPAHIPSPEEHMEEVNLLRGHSQTYQELSLIVRLIVLFQEWRQEEDILIK